jgi:hypothetical protein
MATRVGKTLLEARMGRGIDLYEVQRVTKVRVELLRAIEEDRWEDLPPSADARGSLAAYARYLGLDDEALVEEYEKSIERAGAGAAVPHGVLRSGVIRRRRSSEDGPRIKPVAIAVAGVAAAAVVAVVIIVSVGGSGGNGGATHPQGKGAGSGAKTSSRPSTPASVAMVELRATADVWVCLVDGSGRPLVDGETLAAGETRGPYSGRSFEMTFGNGSVKMTVDDQPAAIPRVARPLGFRILAGSVRKLDPASRPTCL